MPSAVALIWTILTVRISVAEAPSTVTHNLFFEEIKSFMKPSAICFTHPMRKGNLGLTAGNLASAEIT